MLVILHYQQRTRRQRAGGDAGGLVPGPLCSIFERIQVRRATGVTGASGNDYQMAAIGFQGEGAGRSLGASEDSSQQLHNPVWGRRRSAFLPQITVIVSPVNSSPPHRLHLVVQSCLEHPCFSTVFLNPRRPFTPTTTPTTTVNYHTGMHATCPTPTLTFRDEGTPAGKHGLFFRKRLMLL